MYRTNTGTEASLNQTGEQNTAIPAKSCHPYAWAPTGPEDKGVGLSIVGIYMPPRTPRKRLQGELQSKLAEHQRQPEGLRKYQAEQRRVRELRAGAYHEAAHAVARLKLGFPVPPNVELREDGTGHTEGTGVRLQHSPSGVMDWCVMVLAGTVAEERLFPSRRSGSFAAYIRGGREDEEEVWGTLFAALDHWGVFNLGFQLGFRWKASMDTRSATFTLRKWARSRARSLVAEWWDPIGRVAEELLRRRRLSGSDVVELLHGEHTAMSVPIASAAECQR